MHSTFKLGRAETIDRNKETLKETELNVPIIQEKLKPPPKRKVSTESVQPRRFSARVAQGKNGTDVHYNPTIQKLLTPAAAVQTSAAPAQKNTDADADDTEYHLSLSLEQLARVPEEQINFTHDVLGKRYEKAIKMFSGEHRESAQEHSPDFANGDDEDDGNEEDDSSEEDDSNEEEKGARNDFSKSLYKLGMQSRESKLAFIRPIHDEQLWSSETRPKDPN